MFTEVLRIRPVLDTASTKQMESDLSGRFQGVARRFGSGIKAAIKGSLLGIGIGLLAKLLNPLQEVQDKIKNLLEKGSSVADLADRLGVGSSPAELIRLQSAAQSIGIKPDELKDVLTKFADQVDIARKEIQDPFKVHSESTVALGEFAKNPDMVKGFLGFLDSLRARGQGPGRDVFFGEKQNALAQDRLRNGQTLSESDRQSLISQGLLKPITGLESRKLSEEAVFGQALFGAKRGLVENDLQKQADLIGLPKEGAINHAFVNVDNASKANDIVRAKNDLTDFISTGNQLSQMMIQEIAQRDKNEAARVTEQLKNFETLKMAERTLDSIGVIASDLKDLLVEFLAAFRPFFDLVAKITKSKWYRFKF